MFLLVVKINGSQNWFRDSVAFIDLATGVPKVTHSEDHGTGQWRVRTTTLILQLSCPWNPGRRKAIWVKPQTVRTTEANELDFHRRHSHDIDSWSPCSYVKDGTRNSERCFKKCYSIL